MTYSQTIAYLYDQLPAFQKVGKLAIKPKLTNIILLCEAMGNPHRNFKTIHVAGTNGKGSSSHFLASILQEHGLKTGLYTSPHLKDYKERFRINGSEVSESYIIEFVETYTELFKSIQPSFFEVSVALAFKYFSDSNIDIAVIEVGLGGRYDSTNIIDPLLCLITNIGLDHQDILGNTLTEIAYEKAGIIKQNTPVIVSEFIHETFPVFESESKLKNSEIIFAQNNFNFENKEITDNSLALTVVNKQNNDKINIKSGLIGNYQIANVIGVYAAIKKLTVLGYPITDEQIKEGFKNVILNTNLKGRWQILKNNPLTICDTGHNEHALAFTTQRIKTIMADRKHLILGFVKDKDFEKTIKLFPKEAKYYLCSFNSFRALTINELTELAQKNNLTAEFFTNVNDALSKVDSKASMNDFIFIGGSTYLVAELNNL